MCSHPQGISHIHKLDRSSIQVVKIAEEDVVVVVVHAVVAEHDEQHDVHLVTEFQLFQVSHKLQVRIAVEQFAHIHHGPVCLQVAFLKVGEDDIEPAEELIGIEPGQRRRCIHPVVLQFVYHRYGHIEAHLVGVAVAEQLVRHQLVDIVAEVQHAYLAHIEMFGQLAHEGVGRSVVHTEREDDRLHRCHAHALRQVRHIFVLEQLFAHLRIFRQRHGVFNTVEQVIGFFLYNRLFSHNSYNFIIRRHLFTRSRMQ